MVDVFYFLLYLESNCKTVSVNQKALVNHQSVKMQTRELIICLSMEQRDPILLPAADTAKRRTLKWRASS